MLKFIRRVFFGFVFAAAALVVVLVVSVGLDYLLGGSRLDKVTNTTIPGLNGQPDVRAYVARPDGNGPFPVVIMVHEFFGLNASIVSKAEGLAEEGYLVVAPDTFRGSTTSWIPRAIYQVISTPASQINQNLDSVFAWLQAQPDADAGRIGIAGFCYGGRASLGYSLHNNQIAATVMFYGSPETDPQVLKNLPGPLLGIFGGADNSIPLEEVAAFETGLKAAGVEYQVSVYPDQPHAFVQDMQTVRSSPVQTQAWNEMLDFLEKNLKSPGNSLRPQMAPGSYAMPFDWAYYALLVYEHAFGTASHFH